MARSVLNVQAVSRAGLNPVYSAADVANGHEFDNSSGKVVLHVKNGGAGATVVTIQTPGTVDGLAIADLTVSVPAAGERFIGFFPKNIYNQSGGNLVYVNLDVGTSVTLAALKLS